MSTFDDVLFSRSYLIFPPLASKSIMLPRLMLSSSQDVQSFSFP